MDPNVAHLSFEDGSQAVAPTDGPPIQPGRISTVYCIDDLQGVTALRPLGIVRGVTVRSRNVVASIGAGLKSLVDLFELGNRSSFARSSQP